MDTLKNLEIVKNELLSLTSNLTTLNSEIAKLEENEANIGAAWQSANADNFKNQYSQLIANLTEASNYLESYRKKIDSVVKEIVGFDTTIQNQNNG